MPFRSQPPRQTREGGFSVLIVLVILVLLVGLALILVGSSRSDLFGATNEREQAIAFYAAEAGVAHGKAFLSSIPFDPATKYGAALSQTITRTFDYVVPGTSPAVTIPASYTVTFRNNDDGAPDGGLADMDGYVVVRSVGTGPNGARAVIEVTTGVAQTLKAGSGYCAQANPPPSCRGQ